MVFNPFTPNLRQMASFRKIGNKWRAEVCVDGARKSKRFSSKMRAKAWAEDIEQTLREGVTETHHTLADAFDRYAETVSPTHKGERWERIRLKKLGQTKMAQYLVHDVRPADIAAWRDQRLREVSAGSVRREMSLMSGVFSVAEREWGWIARNPMSLVAKPASPKHRDRRITPDEEMALTARLSGEYLALFQLALETGMRLGEMCNITPDAINGKYLTLRDTKNGTRRDVPLSSRAQKVLNDIGNEFTTTSANASAVFCKAVRACKIKDLRFHDTRHEACTRLAQKLDVLDLARMVGMRDPRTLMIYYNPTAAEIADKLG